jgi:uncharacterized protein with HEPN domain
LDVARSTPHRHRNELRHGHDQVDPTRIWEIVSRDLSQLAAAAEAALNRLDDERGGRAGH